jgi:HD superfamily phosphodiesterase
LAGWPPAWTSKSVQYNTFHCSAVTELSSKFCELIKVDVNIALYAISEKSCSLHALQMGPDR